MNGLTMVIVSAVILIAAYLIYGRYLAKKWGIDPNKKTPAHELNDGVDYFPAPLSVIFGHEFASIAGAGPVTGPIIAAMFGWLPVLLWILIGGIFFGAVQDFAALYASVKNKGKTIGYIVELYIGKTGKYLFLIFVWLLCLLAVAAFLDIAAGTFMGFSSAGDKLSANASVATTSILFIFGAILLGFFMRRVKPNEIVSAVVAIIMLVICITLGLAFPAFASKGFWLLIITAYIYIASVVPVWALLQPRDYLNSFLLVFLIAGAFLGIIFASPEITLPAYVGFNVNGQYLFPMLFVIVACGAVSGIHAIIASGTVSKQIDNEKHILPVSFGAMLLESLLAVIALVAVGSLAVGGNMPQGTPPVIFAKAVSGFLLKLGIPAEISYTIIILAVSAFVLTSLDTAARVGRLSFQELFTGEDKNSQTINPIAKFLSNKYVATTITIAFCYILAIAGYQKIWALFGSANQLLAALSLVACAAFLKKTKRQGAALYVPMISMLIVTFTALYFLIRDKWTKLLGTSSFDFASDGLQLILSVVLLILGIVLAISGISKLREKTEA
ncbi:MAG: carbon starvation protein A [Elusimicrobiota bacterium]|jgi:carbon starvation protein|nr:carbon starvation protein A [Elusimicrobiota bacterium]